MNSNGTNKYTHGGSKKSMELNKQSPGFAKTMIAGETLFGFWNAAGKSLAIMNSLLIVYFLSIFQYGFYQLILAFIGLASIFLFDGANGVVLNDVIRHEKAGESETARTLFSGFMRVKLGLGAILSLGVLMSAKTIAGFYDKDIGSFIRIIAIVFILDAAISIFDVFLRAKLRFRAVAMQPFVRELIKMISFGIFLLFGQIQIREVLIVHVISMAALVVILLFIYGKPFFLNLVLPGRGRFFEAMSIHGKWAIMKEYSKRAANNLRPWLIKIFISTEAVALFSLSLSLVGLLQSFFPGAFLSSLIPRELADREKLRRIFVRGLKYLNLLGFIFVIVGVIFAPPAVILLLPKYKPALPYFLLLTLTLPLYSVSKIAGALLVAYRDQKFIFSRTAITILLLLLLAPVLFPAIGLWGAVVIMLLDYLISTLYFIHRATKLEPALRFRFKEIIHFDSYDWMFLKNALREFWQRIKKRRFTI